MSEELRTELERVKREAAALRSAVWELNTKLMKAPSAYLSPSQASEFICELVRDVGAILSTAAYSDYMSKAEVRQIAEELRYWAEGPKHAGDCEFSDKSDEGCWLCMKADRERWPQTSTVMSIARKLGLLEDKQ